MNRSIAMATIPEARLSRGLGLVPHLEEEGPGALAQGGACLLGDGGVGGVGGAKDHAQLRLGRRINGRSLNLLLFRCFITCNKERYQRSIKKRKNNPKIFFLLKTIYTIYNICSLGLGLVDGLQY